MKNKFDFGPIGEINLMLEKDAKTYFGEYTNLPEEVKNVLQLIIHAVIQITNDIDDQKPEVLWVGNTFRIMHMKSEVKGDGYTIGNRTNGMAVITFNKDISGRFSTSFFSVKQLALVEPILDYAYQDALAYGRRI